jgi:hypothetical protein
LPPLASQLLLFAALYAGIEYNSQQKRASIPEARSRM